MLRLVIEDDEGKTTVVPLIRDEITIGRKEGNTIRLTERNVSRRHARILRAGPDDHSVIVEDLESYNGIRLNGDRVSGKCSMRPGDLIQIGDYALALQMDRPTGSTPSVESEATRIQAVDAIAELPDDERGKLVVVSSNLAGQTYPLTRREVIIGRSDENDVVINHRSISRNHAKVVVRDGAFTIIDLRSANGVKVNGEEFGTETLVNGDIIELGHVKLRFVAPGHDYVFSPEDVEDVEISEGGGMGRTLAFAILLVVVALGAFFLVRHLTGGEGEVETGQTTEGEGEKKAGAEVPDPLKTADPSQGTVSLEELLSEGRDHMKEEQWALAIGVFNRVLQDNPGHAEAEAQRNMAQTEDRNRRRYETILKQMADQQWFEALDGLRVFPEESVYNSRLQTKRKSIEAGYAGAELTRGLQLLEEGDVAGSEAVQRELERIGFAQAQAEQLRRAIRAAKKAAEAPKNTAPKNTGPKNTTEKPVGGSGSGTGQKAVAQQGSDTGSEPDKGAEPDPPREPQLSYNQLMQKVSTILIRNEDWSPAVPLLLKATRLRPKAPTPLRQLCVGYQKLGKPSKALRYCKRWLNVEPNDRYKPHIQKQIDKLEAELGR
ncbi:MAG: FHA domain-containing protein [Bradymonadia bacterium]